MRYEYQPLSEDAEAIRVLVLHPAADYDAPINGSIEHVAYSSVEYTAMSYVWGSLMQSHTISVNSRDLRIGANLYSVLRSVRKPSGSLLIWVDAICINQEDIEERSAQVQKMAGIYRNAVEVVGWLGEKTERFDRGFELMKGLIEHDADEYLRDSSYEQAWKDLVELLDRPYWTRAWILQETAINPNVDLRFGRDPEDGVAIEYITNWDDIRFEVVSKWRELHHEEEWEGSIMQRFDQVSNNVYNMGFLPESYPLKVEELQPLLQSYMCGGPLATNPLDYVYGILGLFDSTLVTVDYKLSPRQFYLSVLEAVQHRTQKLDFLSWAWGNHAPNPVTPFTNPFNVPRWALDFSYRTRFVHPIPLANSSQEQRIIWDTFYSASGSSNQTERFDFANSIFYAKGVRVTSINRVGSLASSSISQSIWPRDWALIAELGDLPPPRKQRAERAGAPYLDMWALEGLTTKGPAADMESWWRTLLGDTLSREARIDSSEQDKASVPPRTREGVEILCRHLTEYLQIQVHDGRRIFCADSGALGLAPPRAEVDDVVCVLFGADVPCVLRELGGGQWDFVGEWYALGISSRLWTLTLTCSYLHGMMDGQALEGTADIIDFCIQG